MEAVIYPIIVSAVAEVGNAISSRNLFETVAKNLDGYPDEKNPNVFYSTDFGKLYINTVTKIACDKFGAEPKHEKKNNTTLIFNERNLAKMDKIYGSTKKIQTKLVDNDAADALDALGRPDNSFTV